MYNVLSNGFKSEYDNKTTVQLVKEKMRRRMRMKRRMMMRRMRMMMSPLASCDLLHHLHSSQRPDPTLGQRRRVPLQRLPLEHQPQRVQAVDPHRAPVACRRGRGGRGGVRVRGPCVRCVFWNKYGRIKKSSHIITEVCMLCRYSLVIRNAFMISSLSCCTVICCQIGMSFVSPVKSWTRRRSHATSMFQESLQRGRRIKAEQLPSAWCTRTGSYKGGSEGSSSAGLPLSFSVSRIRHNCWLT